MFRADLHVHSTYSDGEFNPRELIALAKEEGLSGLSITDHDTVEAYPEAIELAKDVHIAIGTGVEFSCVFEGLNVHVLGYRFDVTGPWISQLCLRHKKRRKERNRAILEKLRAHNILIDETELVGNQIGRPHIAQQMVKKGIVSSHKEAFARYLAEGKSCYVQGETFSVEDTIGIIHKDGGKAFLAHPHLLPKRKKWFNRLCTLPFDGLEGYYAHFGRGEEEKWFSLAKEKGWLVSGGSDFHGEVKPYISFGCSWVDETTFWEIFLS